MALATAKRRFTDRQRLKALASVMTEVKLSFDGPGRPRAHIKTTKGVVGVNLKLLTAFADGICRGRETAKRNNRRLTRVTDQGLPRARRG
jgi:hypothetical protein